MSKPTKQPTADAGKVRLLAEDIDKFMYDYDIFGYWDGVDIRKHNIQHIADQIGRGQTDYLIGYFQVILEEEDRPAFLTRAEQLLLRLNGVAAAKPI